MTITTSRSTTVLAQPEPADHDEVLARLRQGLKLVETRSAACRNANEIQSTEPVHTVIVPQSSRHLEDPEAVRLAEEIGRRGRKNNVHLQLWDWESEMSLPTTGFVTLTMFGNSHLLRELAADGRFVSYHWYTGGRPPKVATREPADGRLILITNRRGVKERVYLRDDASAADGEYPAGHRWFDVDPNSTSDPLSYNQIVEDAVAAWATVHLLAEVTLLVAPPPASR